MNVVQMLHDVGGRGYPHKCTNSCNRVCMYDCRDYMAQVWHKYDFRDYKAQVQHSDAVLIDTHANTCMYTSTQTHIYQTPPPLCNNTHKCLSAVIGQPKALG